jgi:hypothetical protein
MYTHTNRQQRRALTQRAGAALSAFTDTVCGHYTLDLAREFDREAALRLAEWSNWESRFMRAAAAPDTR